MQCEFALLAHGELKTLHADQPKHASLLAFAHIVLVFAGNAAKLLASGKSASQEGKARTQRLRTILSINTGDLSEIVRARNYLEHFDERIERSLKVSGDFIIHRLIEDHEPAEMTLDEGRILKPRFLQFLNTTDWYLNLQGDRIYLDKVALTLEEVLAKVRREFNRQGVPGYADAL
jgi:hypothetical protein